MEVRERRRLTCQNKDSLNRSGLNVPSINTGARSLALRHLPTSANRYCISPENRRSGPTLREQRGRPTGPEEMDLF